MSEAARSRRFDPDYEPSMERPQPQGAPADPLAELARLVGQDDPFRGMFKAASPAAARSAGPVAVPRTAARIEPARAHSEPAWLDGEPSRVEPAHDAALRPSVDEWDAAAPAPAVDGGHVEPLAYDHDPYEEQPAELYLPAATEAEAAWDDGSAPVPSVDDWAEDAPHAHAPVAMSDETAVLSRAPRRPLAVLFAVLALTGGGLAATFLARTNAGVARSAANGAPTILASTAPTKIQQVDTAANTNAEDAESALLSKNGESTSGPVKVMKSQEQPVDLAQLPKPVASPDDGTAAQPAAPQSPFPEPKRVKTFLVRPNGAPIPAPASAASTSPTIAQLAATEAPSGSAAAAAVPATPRAAIRAATTPRAAPAPTAEVVAADATNTTAPKTRQPAAPGPKPTAAKPKPVEVADAAGASDAASSPQASGGGFALQLAASASEQDAHDAFARLQKKYSELSGYKATVRKAEAGDKSVYRLRVGNLNQDQAKTLCSQLQASGGSCFVVRN